ncbi:F-box/FBD/LRR-repeat protein At1g13570-like [Triticum aestivum]|uniref:F-box/FBD/LRR-repeat protein At1g13570-like n=1 Tax=Triticum aestivum TaxID=4565 RepID=UPI001D02CBD6|nr:F-box/FBD/LRR-repeat protein At1g13570-like [Triticum aestivum]
MPPPRRSYRPHPVIEFAMAEADSMISLPTDVLDDILSRVGPRDAVRTSALSCAWRRRWEALAWLDLDFEDGLEHKRAVDSILLCCPGRVRLFRAFIDESSRIHDWLLVLSRRAIEILDISGSLTLPSSVFTCGRLTSLHLSYCAIPLLPRGFKGLPELRNLSLRRVDLLENGQYQLEEIIAIATSPLLEEPTLQHVDISGDFKKWMIQGPNLRDLHIHSANDYGWDLGGLPRLDSVVIDICESLRNRDFSKFLSSLASLTELRISTYHQPLNGDNILESLPCTFINLKSLTLLTHFCKLPSILSTFCFPRNAPSLESLKIQVVYGYGMGKKFEANGEFQNARFTDGMCANLQFVDMTGIRLFSNEMSFIEVILSKARLMHTLSISLSHVVELAISKEDGLKKLLNYKKASTDAEVIFEGNESYQRYCIPAMH